MNFNLKIIEINSLTELQDFWTDQDYKNLLEAFDYTDYHNADPGELRELLEMAISDFEPSEAAEILLQYKLGDRLNKGQIQNLSNEILEDNESEEYPDIALHYPLFNINRLLFKSYNGLFPNAKATRLVIELEFPEHPKHPITKSSALSALSHLLRSQNLVIRLYEDELNGKQPFVDAEKIIWRCTENAPNQYTLITSDYWINKEDIMKKEISGSIRPFKEV